MKGVVFLDRDGTINEEVEYLNRVEDLRLIPNAPKAIKALNQAGYKVFVVTNQSAIARGLLTEEILFRIHQRLEKMLEDGGAQVDGWFYCPHHPEAGDGPFTRPCRCRKPDTGMIEAALKQIDQDVMQKFVIGDSLSDMQLALNAGATPILVTTGHGAKALELMDHAIKTAIAYTARDILDAAHWIISAGEDV